MNSITAGTIAIDRGLRSLGASLVVDAGMKSSPQSIIGIIMEERVARAHVRGIATSGPE